MFKISDISDYENITLNDINAYLSSDGHISYRLIDWDLYKFTSNPRGDESEEFWIIYKELVDKIKAIFKDDDFIIDDGGDWDTGFIEIEYKKTISRYEDTLTETFSDSLNKVKMI